MCSLFVFFLLDCYLGCGKFFTKEAELFTRKAFLAFSSRMLSLWVGYPMSQGAQP